MGEKSLMDNIIDGLQKEFNNNPPPQKCVINKIYDDNRVDVKLEDQSFVKYIEVLGNAKKGNEAVLCFLNGSLKEAIVITGDIDLSDYYTRNEMTSILSNYLTDDEVDELLRGKSDVNHTHLSRDITDLINIIYPVGAIYMSVNSTSPSLLFGGEWERIEDTFLLASGTKYTNGSTGGSADAVIVSHNHTQNSHKHSPQSNRKYIAVGNGVNWNYSSKIKIRTDGNTPPYYYPHADKDTSGITEQAETTSVSPTINSTGEDGTGKNMPPYLSVNVWKRTA